MVVSVEKSAAMENRVIERNMGLMKRKQPVSEADVLLAVGKLVAWTKYAGRECLTVMSGLGAPASHVVHMSPS
jgi:hypothetical protein